MWKSGVTIKQIAFDLGKTIQACKYQRWNLSLKPRRDGNNTHRIQCSISEDLFDFAHSRARDRRQNIASYLRMLILRDKGDV